MRRVSIVGNSGSGKSTLGRGVAAALGVPYIELDSIFHRPGWVELPRDDFRREVGALVDGDAWVVDGNYSAVRDLVWKRADTVVFLDLPRHEVMRSVIRRTTTRVLGRTELWNGNREQLGQVFRKDSIVVWAWTQHDKYRRRFRDAMADPEWSSLQFVRLRSRREAQAWLGDIGASSA